MFTLIFLQKMTGVFYGGMRLPAGAGDQFLKNGCRRSGDGVFITEGGEKGLLKFKQGFPSLAIGGCGGGVRGNRAPQTETYRPPLVTVLPAWVQTRRAHL